VRAIFIRHGQSTGIPCHDLSGIELTELGRRQSREVAASWTEVPDLIVTSPFLRTQQTAAPTMERFPDVTVEVWPIQEFTYLQPSRWDGTLSSERMPYIELYWAAADPEFCDGDGAESFTTMLSRVRASLDRLETLPAESLVYVFSHGQFIQAVRSLVLDSELSDREKMRKFWRKGVRPLPTPDRLRWSAGKGTGRRRMRETDFRSQGGCGKPTSDRRVSFDASTSFMRFRGDGVSTAGSGSRFCSSPPIRTAPRSIISFRSHWGEGTTSAMWSWPALPATGVRRTGHLESRSF